jgi:GNAT superfamily N-acetyltransferase
VATLKLRADEDPGEEATVLDDGRAVSIRPVSPDDTEALRAMHRRLSPRTVYQRFFTALPELSEELADRFTHVDGVERVAFVAVARSGELVAVGRYDRLPADRTRAEVAVVVLDDYQHHGLGTRLVRLLAEHARTHGVEAFVADVLMRNEGMFHAFADAGLRAQASYESGVAHLLMPLADQPGQPVS